MDTDRGTVSVLIEGCGIGFRERKYGYGRVRKEV